ncbi:unnamed protein product [Caenorhabditis angaria]|uniref:BTB domain-containing protein n=1 Tax=Caenorhabditis angaria TaxID=860376 RepID=A0A9P1MUZ0_9PELO|nr:unnamed protein product [Caenorhabditis angaria]
MDENGRLSEEFVIDGLKWRIKIKTEVSGTTKYLCVFLRHEKDTADYLAEVSQHFTIFDKNGRRLMGSMSCDYYTKNSNEFGCSSILRWNGNGNGFGFDVNHWEKDFIRIECEFDYKLYDFSNNPAIFSDGVIKIGNDEIHINKGYYCAFSKFFIENFGKNNNTQITINDVKSDDMLMLLASLLPDPIHITSRNYDALMDMSEKFDVPMLIQKCDEHFKKHQCSNLLSRISYAEIPTPKKRRKTVVPEENAKIKELIGSLKRGKEFKWLFEQYAFKEFEDSTKLQIYKASTKFL